MSQFRKKPVVIEAELWDGENRAPIMALANTVAASIRTDIQYHGSVLRFNTPQGVMEAQPGDYIIRGTNGELYPCTPDIFTNIYEPV